MWYYDNKKYRALLALNTAVHPDFQRKGIFSELAKRTYSFAKKAQYDFIYGVSNSNATVGNLKLGFYLVGELYLHLCFDASLKKEQTNFNKRRLSQERSNKFLEWRLNRPFTKYSKTDRRIISKSRTSILRVISKEIDMNKTKKVYKKERFPSIYFYMGSVKQKKMISIPSIFRPAAFNLIFKPLSLRSYNLSANLEDSDLDFLDFINK